VSFARGLSDIVSGTLHVVGTSGASAVGGRPVIWSVAANGTVANPLTLELPSRTTLGQGVDVTTERVVVGHVGTSASDLRATVWQGATSTGDGGKPCKGSRC
jgi:hypothetical protein